MMIEQQYRFNVCLCIHVSNSEEPTFLSWGRDHAEWLVIHFLLLSFLNHLQFRHQRDGTLKQDDKRFLDCL